MIIRKSCEFVERTIREIIEHRMVRDSCRPVTLLRLRTRKITDESRSSR